MKRIAASGDPVDGDPGISGVERCLHEMRQMILSGVLAPGQKVNQAELAEELRVSRVPVREALSRLSAEGLLQYRPNIGFSVSRFNGAELSEIYLMRRLLETELLRQVDVAAIDVAVLTDLNGQMRAVEHRKFPEQYQRLNVDFHFLIFAASPLSLVRQEVERLWNMSAYYRSLHLFVTDDTTHLSTDHDRIIESVRQRDLEGLITASDHHRAGTERLDGRHPSGLGPS